LYLNNRAQFLACEPSHSLQHEGILDRPSGSSMPVAVYVFRLHELSHADRSTCDESIGIGIGIGIGISC
jgi:hypothetical protein